MTIQALARDEEAAEAEHKAAELEAAMIARATGETAPAEPDAASITSPRVRLDQPSDEARSQPVGLMALAQPSSSPADDTREAPDAPSLALDGDEALNDGGTAPALLADNSVKRSP